MNTGSNQNLGVENLPGPMGYILGKGILPQIILSILIALVLYSLFMGFEMIYKSYKAVKGTRVTLLDMTVSSETKPREYEQNPNAKNAKLIPLSDNERTGAEFTYSFFIYINPSSFRQEDGLLHIMHKGYSTPYPLLGPGVFLKNNQNCLRIYMNSTRTWNNYVEVENIPVKKWVHVVILARNNAIEIYINGNLAKKLNLEGATFYQNFGNLYLFNQRTCVINPTNSPSAGSDILQVLGTYSGLFSNLFYFSYALTYTEIQGLMAIGPSKKTEGAGDDAPPYLEDSWWVTNYST
jgi:hypothetical protein